MLPERLQRCENNHCNKTSQCARLSHRHSFNNIRLDCKMNVSVQNTDLLMLPGNNHLFILEKRIFTRKKNSDLRKSHFNLQ